MASTSSSLPKAPVSTPAPPPSASASVLSPADISRGFDLLIHYLTFYMLGQAPLHPDDMAELKAISARIRASSNL